jgi:hypothetical protein
VSIQRVIWPVNTPASLRAALDKFASEVQRYSNVLENVATLPTTDNFTGKTLYNTTDNQSYMWNGTEWIQLIDLTWLGVKVLDATMEGVAASKITGQLTSSQIADIEAAKLTGLITETQISDNAISTPKLQAGSITGEKIVSSTITSDKIQAYTITGNEIKGGTITAAKIAAGTITSVEIAAATITGGNIAGSTITAGNIAANTITAAQIDASYAYIGSLNANQVYAGTLNSSIIYSGTLSANQITAGTLTAAIASAGQITVGTLGGSVLYVGSLNANQVTTGTLGATVAYIGSLDANQITVGTLGGSVVYAGSLNANQIVVGTLGGSVIYAGTVAADHITAGTLNSGVLNTGTMNANLIAAGTLGANVIYAGTLAANLITSGTLNSGVINTGTLSATQITAGSMLANYIYGGTLGACYITSGTINANIITTGTLSANIVSAGTMLANRIYGGTLGACLIEAGTLNANIITTGTMSADRITAGTMQADRIYGGTLGACYISAGTISANAITTGTMLADRIYSGTLSSTVFYAGTIYSNQITIKSAGALNLDPGFADSTAWVWGYETGSGGSFLASASGASGSIVARNQTGYYNNIETREYFVIDTTKTYRLSFWARASSTADGTLYGCIRQYQYDGTPCTTNSGRSPYKPSSIAKHTNWVYYTNTWEPADFQSECKKGTISILLNYGGTAGYWEIQDAQVKEAVDADLIVDGTISADKLTANHLSATNTESGTFQQSYAAPSDNNTSAGTGLKITGGNIEAYGNTQTFGGPLIASNGTYLAAIGKSFTGTGATKRYPLNNSTNFNTDGKIHLYAWYNSLWNDMTGEETQTESSGSGTTLTLWDQATTSGESFLYDVRIVGICTVGSGQVGKSVSFAGLAVGHNISGTLTHSWAADMQYAGGITGAGNPQIVSSGTNLQVTMANANSYTIKWKTNIIKHYIS